MEQQLTQPLCIVSGPTSSLPECGRALAAGGLTVLLPEGHGLPSHPDPLTAAAAGAPNSGHQPGTLHPAELHYIVVKGDHGKDHPDCPGRGCQHIGQIEARPNPLEQHIGQPYEEDPSIGFLAVQSDDPDRVAGLVEPSGWGLRMHVSPVLQTVEPELTDEDRIALIEQQLAALKGGRA